MLPCYRFVNTSPNSRINHQLAMPSLAKSFFPNNPSLEKELARLFPGFCSVQESPNSTVAEEVMNDFRHNGRDYEYCPDLENHALINFNHSQRKKKNKVLPECVFCKNNGEEASYYKLHTLRDENGIVRCPVLRAYRCPICGADGDQAHTLKYCPTNKDNGLYSFSSLKSLRNSTGKRRIK